MASILDVYGHEFSVWVDHRHLRLHDLDPGNMETVASLPGNLGISAWFCCPNIWKFPIYGNSLLYMDFGISHFVSWDDEIPNMMGKSFKIPWLQSPPTRL